MQKDQTSLAASPAQDSLVLSGNEGMRALHISFKGLYTGLIPSFPIKNQPEERIRTPSNFEVPQKAI